MMIFSAEQAQALLNGASWIVVEPEGEEPVVVKAPPGIDPADVTALLRDVPE